MSAAALPGTDRIASPALVHTAQAVAAEALRAPLREVRARVVDDGRGALAVEVTSPLVLPALGSHTVPDEPVLATAHRARATIAERLRTITGRKVERVSVTFSSAVLDVPRRVR
ncbi:hypothetical protein DEJ33_07390 [Curtobacterium sp. MCPF17_047]|uniref:hypothetical protein n=1 Tax=unclassified Curtobacterium TaxID=257496 RepID=UPI000DA8CE6A|nr:MULTISPECIES: hypothetical protein [unclassified Curtobacterium]PZF67069.1 hypothetical protein DEJ33_07390 [Curtobacterium sp. MCPF17_047]WIB11769.1 hypothetical protein DEJ36_12820 [Curtobacterium sp. MCPF17_052]